jgi:SAM-dependent methyltransferase
MFQTVRKSDVLNTVHPGRCYLCNAEGWLVPARFQLLYPQHNTEAIPLDWWECHSCGGWFLYPVPTPAVIAQYWKNVEWADPDRETEVANAKRALQLRILDELRHRINPASLLDFGCNYGKFLLLAREKGWSPIGFEPNPQAAAKAREKGFEVRSGWSLEEAGFAAGQFAAITAVDVFCLVWDPATILRVFHRLLEPGGVLAMRLTNKHFILRALRAVLPEGRKLDIKISKVLLPQFHSIGMGSLARILEEIGFDQVCVLPRATTAPWASLSWRTRSAYVGAAVLDYLSLRAINVSPGVLLFAHKTVG